MIQNEVSILRRVKHPNIVLLIEEMDTYSELYLVMELVKVTNYFHIWNYNVHFNKIILGGGVENVLKFCNNAVGLQTLFVEI